MAKPSKSPDRMRFLDRTGMYADRDVTDEVQGFRDAWGKMRQQQEDLEATPEWAVDNMEHDLRTTGWILDKVRANDIYAQNLYAALCNNDFVKRDVYNVLIDKRWSCSWRRAGGIVADMRGEGDYIEWYCSGSSVDEDGAIAYGTQPEGFVTDEIKNDLRNLGWSVVDA